MWATTNVAVRGVHLLSRFVTSRGLPEGVILQPDTPENEAFRSRLDAL